MLQIRSLANTTLLQLHYAFTHAFSDYTVPLNLTEQQLQYMLDRRGYNPELSFGAFSDYELVGFILNGIGDWQGQLTAYDTGTGVVPEYRRQGITTRLFDDSIQLLKQKGITQYLLEVIRTNTKAVDLYRKAGFDIVRELDYFVSTKDKLAFRLKPIDAAYSIQRLSIPDWPLLRSFWNFYPSWQNSIASIKRKETQFIFLGLYHHSVLIGYGIIDALSGDIPQFAIASDYRRAGLGTNLFQQLVSYTESETVKIINTDASYLPFRKFAESVGFVAGYGQYEMMKDI